MSGARTTVRDRTNGRSPVDPGGAGRPIQHRAVLITVCVALASVVAAMSSLNVALPDLARSTQASQTELEWIIDAYSLVFASLLLPCGALGDRYGRRLSLIIGLAIFGGGSIVAMTTSGPTELIALRAVLGLGAALVMPATLSTITGTFAAEQRTKAVSVWAAVAGGSAILGVLTSGVLLEYWSWRSVFGLNVALAAIALVLTVKFVPESAAAHAPRLDVVGAVLAVLGLVALVYSIIEAPTQGWASSRTLLGIAIGLVILTVFVLVELRTRTPMLDPRVFTHRGLAAGSTSIFVQFFAFFGFIFIVLQYLQLVRSDSALVAALSMLPLAVGLMPAARFAPNLVARFGSRRVCCTGLILVAASLLLLSRIDAASPYWLLVVGLVPLGVGMGSAMTPATSSITSALPASQQGVGSALNDLSRELGGAIGIAVMGSVLAATYRDNMNLGQLPPELADAARNSLAAALHLGGPFVQPAMNAFVDGLHAALIVAAIAAAAASLLVGLLMGRTPTSSEAKV